MVSHRQSVFLRVKRKRSLSTTSERAIAKIFPPIFYCYDFLFQTEQTKPRDRLNQSLMVLSHFYQFSPPRNRPLDPSDPEIRHWRDRPSTIHVMCGPIAGTWPSPFVHRVCSQLHPSEMTGSAIKIALNGSIGLEVTPPEEVSSPGMSSNTSMVTVPSLHHPPPSPVMSPHSSQEHLQGTIVWYNLMWGKRKSNNSRNKWLWTRTHTRHVHTRSSRLLPHRPSDYYIIITIVRFIFN